MEFFKMIRSMLKPSQPDAPEVLPGRNEDCWCGSGKKYKKCHMAQDETGKAKKACSLNCGPT